VLATALGGTLVDTAAATTTGGGVIAGVIGCVMVAGGVLTAGYGEEVCSVDACSEAGTSSVCRMVVGRASAAPHSDTEFTISMFAACSMLH